MLITAPRLFVYRTTRYFFAGGAGGLGPFFCDFFCLSFLLVLFGLLSPMAFASYGE